MNRDREMPAREDYPIVPLDELCDLCSGITKGRKLDSPDTVEVPYMAVANVQDGRLSLDNVKTIEATPEEIERYLLRPGDLLLTEGGDPDKLGRGAIWNGEIGTCIHQNHIFRARKATERIEMAYLARLVSSPYGKRYFLRQSKQTTGIASINMGQLKRFPVLLPPLEEQRRIAAILDKAHSTKRLAIAASDRFESLSLAIFEELFGSSAWPTATLEDVTSRITNGYVGPTRDVYVDEGIPYLLARHVKNGRLSYCGSPKVSATFNEKNKKSKLMEGDVLLVQSGHIGSSCVVPREHDGHNCHAMIVLSPIRDLLLGQYLSLLFRTQRLQRLFKSIQTGITLPHLNCRDVRRIQIPLPPIEKQIWLSERISTLSGGSALAVDQINLISMLERSLTDQLLGSK